MWLTDSMPSSLVSPGTCWKSWKPVFFRSVRRRSTVMPWSSALMASFISTRWMIFIRKASYPSCIGSIPSRWDIRLFPICCMTWVPGANLSGCLSRNWSTTVRRMLRSTDMYSGHVHWKMILLSQATSSICWKPHRSISWSPMTLKTGSLSCIGHIVVQVLTRRVWRNFLWAGRSRTQSSWWTGDFSLKQSLNWWVRMVIATLFRWQSATRT